MIVYHCKKHQNLTLLNSYSLGYIAAHLPQIKLHRVLSSASELLIATFPFFFYSLSSQLLASSKPTAVFHHRYRPGCLAIIFLSLVKIFQISHALLKMQHSDVIRHIGVLCFSIQNQNFIVKLYVFKVPLLTTWKVT